MTDYELAAGKVAAAYLGTRVRPCMNCGHPYIDGLICTNCRDKSPGSPIYSPAPTYDASAPIPPARDPNETYRVCMAQIDAKVAARAAAIRTAMGEDK
jgi:hypothetical protein